MSTIPNPDQTEQTEQTQLRDAWYLDAIEQARSGDREMATSLLQDFAKRACSPNGDMNRALLQYIGSCLSDWMKKGLLAPEAPWCFNVEPPPHRRSHRSAADVLVYRAYLLLLGRLERPQTAHHQLVEQCLPVQARGELRGLIQRRESRVAGLIVKAGPQLVSHLPPLSLAFLSRAAPERARRTALEAPASPRAVPLGARPGIDSSSPDPFRSWSEGRLTVPKVARCE